MEGNLTAEQYLLFMTGTLLLALIASIVYNITISKRTIGKKESKNEYHLETIDTQLNTNKIKGYEVCPYCQSKDIICLQPMDSMSVFNTSGKMNFKSIKLKLYGCNSCHKVISTEIVDIQDII